MKNYLLIPCLLVLVSCGHPEHKTPMFFGLFGPQEWPEEHWEGQNYEPLIGDHQNRLPSAERKMHAIVSNAAGLSPQDFVQSLKDAGIIRRVYNERAGLVDIQNTGKVIIDLAPNFYALSNADQQVLGELLARSYQKDTYILKDAHTGRTVGQITPEGLNLF